MNRRFFVFSNTWNNIYKTALKLSEKVLCWLKNQLFWDLPVCSGCVSLLSFSLKLLVACSRSPVVRAAKTENRIWTRTTEKSRTEKNENRKNQSADEKIGNGKHQKKEKICLVGKFSCVMFSLLKPWWKTLIQCPQTQVHENIPKPRYVQNWCSFVTIDYNNNCSYFRQSDICMLKFIKRAM